MTPMAFTQTVRTDLLRFALRLDAAVTAVNAVAYLALFALLDGLLGVPAAVLIGAGAILLPFAAFVACIAAKPSRAAVIGIIAVNVVWALDSFAVLAAGVWNPTVAGQVVIAVQAVGVLGLAALQAAGLRRA